MKITIPPVILKAGTVSPNKLKIVLPRMTKVATMKNAVMVAFREIFFFSTEVMPWVIPIKAGRLAMGFMMANRPRNTVMAKPIRFPKSIKWLLTDGKGSNNLLKKMVGYHHDSGCDEIDRKSTRLNSSHV